MLATRIVLTFAATAAALHASTPAAATPPLAAYGQLPGISNITISPDGTRWAAILGDESHAEIQIRQLADAKLISVTPTKRAKARGLQWVGPDHLLATVSATANVIGLTGPRREWFMMSDFSVKDKKWRSLGQSRQRYVTRHRISVAPWGAPGV